MCQHDVRQIKYQGANYSKHCSVTIPLLLQNSMHVFVAGDINSSGDWMLPCFKQLTQFGLCKESTSRPALWWEMVVEVPCEKGLEAKDVWVDILGNCGWIRDSNSTLARHARMLCEQNHFPCYVYSSSVASGCCTETLFVWRASGPRQNGQFWEAARDAVHRLIHAYTVYKMVFTVCGPKRWAHGCRTQLWQSYTWETRGIRSNMLKQREIVADFKGSHRDTPKKSWWNTLFHEIIIPICFWHVKDTFW